MRSVSRRAAWGSAVRTGVGGLAVWLLLIGTAAAQGAATRSQTFEVYVPPRLTGRVAIQGPVNVRIYHDGTNNNQTFSDQRWDVGCNNAQGARLQLETRSAFRLTGGGPPVRRDARIELGILSQEAGAGWIVTTPVAQTNYAAGVGAERVSVYAESFAPGDATFNLRVHFLTVDYTTLRQGDYNMRVVGTVSAK